MALADHTQQPLNTLLASAQRVTSRTMKRGWGRSKAWQEDAWDMFDLVGEHRFLAVTLAQRMSQARFFVGKVAQDPTEEPEPVEDTRFTDVLDSIGSSAAARAQLVARLGVNLFVAGDGWLVGIPRDLIPASLLVGPISDPLVDPGLIPVPAPGDKIDIADLDWRMMSITEVSTSASGEVTLRLGETPEEIILANPDRLILIRVWRPHPRKWWEADSPTRSSLPVLRELVGLTMHVSAQVDSRLAGAGMLIVPQSAQRALQIAAGIEDGDTDADADQFTPALMEAMLKPISDRASASAIVPLIVTVPDEACDKFKFISFDKPLDLELRELRDETIRRLALGLDAPPELLLGTGGINHWGAWLVMEDVVATHLEPSLALICDAITTQYLWPVLVDQGMTLDKAREYVIWYDVDDLVVRPTRGADAQALHAAGAISDAALRNASGFDDSDAPEDPAAQHPVEVLMALDMVRADPSLMSNPGLPQIVAQLRAVLTGDIPAVLDPSSVVRAAQEKTDNAIPPAGQTAPALPGAKAPDGGAKATPATGPTGTGGRPVGSTAGPTTPPAAGVPAGGVPAAKIPPPGSIAASATAAAAPASGPVAAGIAVCAADTGRVLMLQRANTQEGPCPVCGGIGELGNGKECATCDGSGQLEADPAAGTWEFPGGGIEPGEQPMTAAMREWVEETGCPFPQGEQTGEWMSSNGVYQGFVWTIPREGDVQLNLGIEDRHVLNPDDPDGDQIEVLAWWDPNHLDGNPAVRGELAADLPLVLAAIGPSLLASAAAFGGPGSGRYPKGSGKHPRTGPPMQPGQPAKPGAPAGKAKDPGALPSGHIKEGFKPNPAQLKKMIEPLLSIVAGLDKGIAGLGLGKLPRAKPVGDLKGDTVKSKVAELEKEIAAAKAVKSPAAKIAVLQKIADARAELDVLSKRAITAAAAGHVSSQDDIAGKPHKAHPDEKPKPKPGPVHTPAPAPKPSGGAPRPAVPPVKHAVVTDTSFVAAGGQWVRR